jgi:hypothetical protein
MGDQAVSLLSSTRTMAEYACILPFYQILITRNLQYNYSV